MSKQTIKPLSAAVGIAFAATMALSATASAAGNPFQADQLSSGYKLAGDRTEGKCGEGKCGGEKAAGEGKCGEGKCGGEKATGEGKCGEGKCGDA
jgi:uncharacterized low-complexity protein